MKTMIRRGLAAAAVAAAGLALAAPSQADTSTPATTGGWEFFSPQTFSDQVVTVPGGTTYKTAVRAPINADGSSNFTAKRGVVPVQFDLLAAPSTTTTTTRTYDPPVWEAIKGIGWPDAGYASYATFTPSSSLNLTFAQVTNLSATYAFTEGDCYVGSLRWTISTDKGDVYAYYGTPNGPDQGCTGANSGSGQNLIIDGITPYRFEVQGAGSPVYTTYAAATALVGADAHVNYVSLILESGWLATQRANISNVTVNDNTWVPKTTEVISSETVTGAFAKTCTLPEAQLRWAKDDADPSGVVNEALSVQPKDTNGTFRQVDCKYIYNLDVSTLTGAGTYQIYANIGGADLADPAVFDLR